MDNLISRKQSMPISTSIQRRRNPFLSIQQDLDQAISDFNHWFHLPYFSEERFEDLTLLLAIDIVEDKDNFKVEAEMPGMGEEDVKVTLNPGKLTIKGEKTTSKQDKGKNYLSREINYGSYERNIDLPDSVDINNAKASFKKGMLWVDIPKKPEAIQEQKEVKVEKAD